MLPDAGVPDAGPASIDAGRTYTCDEGVMSVDGVLDDVVSVTLDTSAIELAPRDLGPDCGNASAEVRWAPQAVVELHVPGTGPVAVAFDTINEVTLSGIAVVVQARTECTTVPASELPSVCFGPVEPGGEWRTRGAVAANGGDTLYFIVTGYSQARDLQPGLLDAGPIRIDFRVSANQPPTLTSAEIVYVGEDVRIDAQGMDPDGNADSLAVNFFIGNQLLDLYGTGAPTELNSLFVIPMTNPAPTGTTWTGGNTVPSDPMDGRTQLGEYLVARGADMAQVVAVDALNGTSAPIMVPIVSAAVVGYGEACSNTARCDAGYACGTGGSCEASPAAVARCGTARVVTVPAFTDTAVTAQVAGQTGEGTGFFGPLAGCASPDVVRGPEGVYRVDVASGVPFDLVLTTDSPVTGRTDTVMYVRTDCADPSSEAMCSDDRAMGDPQSEIELRDQTDGSFFVFVEQKYIPPVDTANHQLLITARPVLPMGATCDDAEVMNRCANGPCAASVCP